MAGILIYCEKDSLCYELLTAARQLSEELGSSVKALVIDDKTLANSLSVLGAEVYLVKNPVEKADTAAVASVLAQAANKLDCDILLLASNRRGKELSGRLAQKLDAGCLNDVQNATVIDGKIHCQRNALNGATIATQYIASARQVIAIAPHSFNRAMAGGATQAVHELDIQPQISGIRLLASRQKSTDSVDIEAARIIVAVGQGLPRQEDLALAEAIAEAVGGVVACSKPVATDKKWMSEERIIGLSGKICKPDLALILGISGQVQFVVGIRDAKVVATINNDENCYMFKVSDYCLTADLNEALPALKSALGK